MSLRIKRFPWPRAFLEFIHPEAEAVAVVMDDERRIPMQRLHGGRWRARVRGPVGALYGERYHLEVLVGSETLTITDPRARWTERTDDGIIGRFANLEHRWRHRFRAPPVEDIVIYETHLPALTRHETAPVDDVLRGTYAGAKGEQVLDHLARLGVTVEFLPLHANNELFGQDWGYFSTSFHAPSVTYAANKNDANRELMALVDAMHARGLPVMVDVVYNHGGELLADAWGKERVYRKLHNGYFCEGSGCGPTLRTEEPLVRELMVESLLHLVRDYRVDGFRFDLGALHDIETMLEIDRRLPKRVYLVAEPWALGGQQWGKGSMTREFIGTRWAIWNDDFREPGRKLVLGDSDHHNRDRVMTAITGSHEFDGGWASRPQQSVNYLTAHDGHTLADLVGGDARRQFLGVTLVLTSQGIPMLSEGTELMFSKGGEHNSYDRPDLNALDWSQLSNHRDLSDAIAGLIALRRAVPHFKYRRHLRRRNGDGHEWDIDFLHPHGYPHDDNTNALGFVLRPPDGALGRRDRQRLIVLLNGSPHGADFSLPPGSWKLLVDGMALRADARGLGAEPAVDHFHVHGGAAAVLAHRLAAPVALAIRAGLAVPAAMTKLATRA